VRRHLAKELYYVKNPTKQTNKAKYPPFDPTSDNLSDQDFQRLIDTHIGWEVVF
jgi:hypothetical protein